jgi:F-type H+-transporting ATPase subunit b
MLIDWFTVGAQTLNFIILVWLLKRFLYKPILDAIDAREKIIATKLADAIAKESEAGHQRDEFTQKNRDFDQQRDALLKQANTEAQTESQQLLDEAKATANTLLQKRQEALRIEHRDLHEEIKRRTSEEVFEIARKTLSDLSGTTIEKRMSEVFLQHLKALDDDAKMALVSEINHEMKSLKSAIKVMSAFELPTDTKEAIQETLNSFSESNSKKEIEIIFEIKPSLINGVALMVNGQKLAWSVADYIDSLEKNIAQLFETKAESGAKASEENSEKIE